MLIVNLWDTEFVHVFSQSGKDCTAYNMIPSKIQYVRDQMDWDGITLFTNNCLEKVLTVKSKIKVAWMLEARAIFPSSYQKLEELEDKFDYIITYYEDLLQRNPQKYLPYIMGCSRINEPDQKIYEKTKLVSHLVTRQNSTDAHKFRHFLASYIDEHKLPITIFGPNHTPYPTKLETHKDFMFSIIIMNSSENFFITEWLIDCLLCGTIPIFYGCPKIHYFFNPDGILLVNSLNDIINILPTLSKELYDSKKDAIAENFTKAKAFQCPDDMVADILLKILV